MQNRSRSQLYRSCEAESDKATAPYRPWSSMHDRPAMSTRASWYLTWAMLSSIPGQAQQLVPNGDFESYTLCPDYVSQIDRASGWSRPTAGTSDYFNGCLGVPFSMSVPDNQFGVQAANSGDGYVGFYAFYAVDEPEVPGYLDREYVTHALSTPLVPGETYSVSFRCSLADASKYAVNDLGLLLSTYVPYRPDNQAIAVVPQVRNTALTWLADKDGWTRIGACFIADSAYSHLTIGNFNDGATTNFLEVGTQYPLTWFSYYYVDDASVIHVPRPELGPDITACGPMSIAVMAPAPGVAYTWSTGETGPSIMVGSSGTYIVAASVDGCMAHDSTHITFPERLDPILPRDTAFDFCAFPDQLLQVGGLPSNASVTWSTGWTDNPITVEHPGDLGVLVEAPGYCPAHAVITIADACQHPVFIPNAFSPNGDGINDCFVPLFDPYTTAFSYSILDRWGHELFRSDAGRSWDGADVPPGIYALRHSTVNKSTNMLRSGWGHVVVLH